MAFDVAPPPTAASREAALREASLAQLYVQAAADAHAWDVWMAQLLASEADQDPLEEAVMPACRRGSR